MSSAGAVWGVWGVHFAGSVRFAGMKSFLSQKKLLPCLGCALYWDPSSCRAAQGSITTSISGFPCSCLAAVHSLCTAQREECWGAEMEVVRGPARNLGNVRRTSCLQAQEGRGRG